MSSEHLKDTHSLLTRQLRRSQVTASSLDETTKQLLASVNTAYQDFDRTREMLERSLELSSQELRQANAELRVLLEQRSAAEKEMEILHAQRLEATGLLAGGVAHDFNNLLAVIKGSCEVLMKLPAPEDLQRELVRQIETAAARAAALTKQLLVFSRRQVLEPREIDLNVTIAGLEHIYQPLVGDDIELRWALDPKLPSINADQSARQRNGARVVDGVRNRPSKRRIHHGRQRDLEGHDVSRLPSRKRARFGRRLSSQLSALSSRQTM
jgi:signal transduction histidine kinase